MPTNGMTIESLNTVSSMTAQDEVPVWDKEASGEPTRKITAQNMANSVKSLASLPNTTEMNTAIDQSTADVIRTGDVVDNLTSTSATSPLSAAQGKVLNDKLTERASLTLTLNSSYENSFTNIENGTFVQLKLWVMNLCLRTVNAISTGEKNIGRFTTPQINYISGVIINNADSSIVGSYIIANNGSLYINPSQKIPANTTIRLNGIGCVD